MSVFSSPLVEMDEHAAGSMRVDESDETRARARAADLVDERHAGLVERSQNAVDIRRLESDVMQPRTSPRD